MNPRDQGFQRAELESDYDTWASICEDKHGRPRLFSREELKGLSDSELAREVKKLREIARTPHD